MDWNDLRFFLALARSGSVRAAGASLSVSHSTVARRVESLEEQLATRLFDRHRDGYLLTDAGQQMVAGAERVEREMAALERSLVGRDEKLAGPVRITCCDDYVSRFLMQDLAQFCRKYPDIELQFAADSRSFDLSKREADIAVRILPVGACPPEHLLGRKLVPLYTANYLALAHASRLDPELEDNRPPRIAPDEPELQTSLIAASSYPHLKAWGSFNSLRVMVQAALEGLGLVTLPCYAGDSEAGLRRLKNPDLRHLADIWLLSHPDLRDNARFLAARECVSRSLMGRGALFRGEVPMG